MTRPIRVLIVASSLDKVGGQSIQADRLSRRLGELAGLKIGFLPVNPRLSKPFRALQRVKYVRTFVTSLAYLWSLLRSVPHYDIVHAFSASYWSFLLAPVPAMLVGRLFGKRVVLNYRSGEADDHLSTWRSALWGIRLADVVVAPSGYLVDVFARHGVAACATSNFVDTDLITWRDRPAPRPRFFGNRHFEPLYNVACVVRAFARIQREIPEAELVLAGDGPEREAIERLISELDCRNVRLAGRVAPTEMPALYDWADVFLNAPNIDNMPSSVIECFAAGLPVASTEAGGIPYVVTDGETGLLVPLNDDDALARAALRLVRESGLSQRLTANALIEVRHKYVWSAVRDRWAAIYTHLAVGALGRVNEPCAG
jgi:L-malate glycosyltransferase